MSGSLSPTVLEAIVLIVVLAAVGAGLMLYLIRRLRARREQLLHELRDSPVLLKDRAFNRLAMARREAEILARSGVDVTTAQGLMKQAQSSYDLHSFDRAYEQAQSAHEALVNARRGTAPRLLTPSPASTAVPVSPRPFVAADAPRPPPAAPIPKNRAESQFQIHVLDGELEAARTARPNDPTVSSAASIRGDAGAAFDRGDFTDAFRLALKGRRVLGGRVEALAPSPGARAMPTVGGGVVTADDDTPDVLAERTAGAARCTNCGYPLLNDDAFCRGCGKPMADPKCPQCGTPRLAGDTFCGRCGYRYA